MTEDIELLRRYAVDGSEAAFAEVVHRRIGFVYSVALRQTRNRQWAEEVVQKVFVSLAGHAAKLSGRETILGWLHATTQNKAIDLMRSELSRRRREAETALMSETVHLDEAGAEWENTRRLLDAAIARLSPIDRDALLLRYYDGQRFEEIGRRLRLNENAARMRVERSLAKLRRNLSALGIGSTLAALESALGGEPAGLALGPLAQTVAKTATASAAPGAAAGIVAFMATSKLAIGVAGLIAVLAVFFSGVEIYRAEGLHKALAAERTQIGLSRAALQTALNRRSTPRELNLTSTDVPKSGPAETWDPLEQGQAFLRRHPDIRRELAEYRRLAFQARYGAFVAPLHLTEDEIKRLENLMISAPSLPWGPGGKLITIDYNEPPAPGADFVASVTEILGRNGVDALQAYDEACNVKQAAASIAASLSFSNEPLTANQTDRLVAAIAAHHIPAANGHNAKPDWAAVAAAATAFLTPSQQMAVANRSTAQIP